MLEDIIKRKYILPKDTVLGNRYIIEEHIGSGGMADVYSAYDREMRLRLALKILQRKHTSNEEFIERFKREASAAARLNHPCIVRVHNVGELEGYYFISMELVKGVTLTELMKSYASHNQLVPTNVPINITCEIASKVLGGLVYAHRERIIHRDITPGNILVNMEDDDISVKITDFGIAKIMIEDGSGQTASLTREGNPPGTFQYVSPEIINRKAISGKADVFSLGAIVYEMLTRRLICGNVNEMPDSTIMFNILHKPMKLPREFNKDIPYTLQNILLKAIDKDEKKRYSSKEFHQALTSFIKGEKVKVEGSLKRKMLLTRRELLIKTTKLGTAALIIVAASYLGVQRWEYDNSIAFSLDQIQKPSVNSLENMKPLLIPLYRRLCDRFEFMNDNELINQKNDMRGSYRPRIYPFGSISSGAEKGRFAYLGGDSLTAGFIIPMCYYAFEELETKQPLKKTNNRLLGAMFEYAEGIYFAKEEHGDNLNDEKELVMARFYRPMEAMSLLKKAHPSEYSTRKKEANIIRSRFAEAVKIIIEKRYNPHTKHINWLGPNVAGNTSQPSAKRDAGIAETLCDAFRLLDLENEVFLAYPKLGTTIKDVNAYLSIIIDDADAKTQHLIRSNRWLREAESKDYADLIIGMVYRSQLFNEISEASTLGNDSKGECFLKNISRINPEQMLRVIKKKKECQNIIKEMISYFISKTPESMISNYYLEKKPVNPTDTIATMRFLEGISRYEQRWAGNIDLNQVKFRILKSILSKEHISYTNTTKVSNQNPYGFVKNTLIDIARIRDYNGTYIETDYLLMKNIRQIIKK